MPENVLRKLFKPKQREIRPENAPAESKFIRGPKIRLHCEPPQGAFLSSQPEIRRVTDRLDETLNIQLYLPNSIQASSTAERVATRHTDRGAVVLENAGIVDFDQVAGRGGDIPMMLVVKGVGAKHQKYYFTNPALAGAEKSRLAFSYGATLHRAADTDTFRERTVNEETYVAEEEDPDVMLLTSHSYSRPYGAQTLPLAKRALECSESLAGSNIKYTPEIAVIPLPDEIKEKIIAATRRAGMPVSEELSTMGLAQELILYPQSTIRGLQLLLPREETDQLSSMDSRRRALINKMFPTEEVRANFLDKMSEDAYWILNWPARNASISSGSNADWRRINDFYLNEGELYQDLLRSRHQRRLLQNNVAVILEGRTKYTNFSNIQNKEIKQQVSGGIFFAAARHGWAPFVLKDLVIDPEHGCFITDFESSEVVEDKNYGAAEHELWVYGVLYEFLTLAVAISDDTEKSELVNIILGGDACQDGSITLRDGSTNDYQTFYDRIKEIYLNVLRKLTEQHNGEMNVRLSDDENEINITLNYKDDRIPTKMFTFHILDFIKM